MQTACRTPCSRVAGDVGGRPNRIEHAKIRLRDETQGLRDRRRFSLRLAAKGKCRRSRCYRKLATRHAVSHHFSSDGSGSTGRSVARIRPCRRWQSDGITRRARLRFSRAHWRPARVPSPGPYDCHLVKLGRLGDDRVVQQDGDGSELDCPQRQAGNSHWRAFSYSGTRTPLIRLPRNAGHTGRMDDANHTQPLAAELSGQDRATFIRGRTYPSTEPIVELR